MSTENKSKTDRFSGVLPIYKPEGWTSFDVIARLRGILGMRRLGHGGTLDPMADGVLPVFAGGAAKLTDFVPDREKVYRAEIQFGACSDTGDRTGALREAGKADFDRVALEAVLREMTGPQMQIPPMYSAVKVNGRRLYTLARAGVEVERRPRPITVFRAELERFSPEQMTADVIFGCSRGTYVRVLAEDLAAKLGTGGYLTALRRTEAMGISLAECHTMEEMEQAVSEGTADRFFLPGERLFAGCDGISLNEKQTVLFCNGGKLALRDLTDRDGAPLDPDRIFTLPVFSGEHLLGMGERRPEESFMRIRRLFHLS